MLPSAPRAPGRRFHVPLVVWIVLAVVAIHAVFFWAVSDKHFLPKTRYVPPSPTPNFGGTTRRSVDAHTGEVTSESLFVVSTTFATPTPKPAPTADRIH